MDRLALILIIVGALNWLLVGLFQFDIVAALLGGPQSLISRAVYIIIGLAGVWAISLLVRERSRAAR